jgi:hypothetical protein
MYAAFKLPTTFEQIIPSLGPWVNSLATDKFAVSLQLWFAHIEVIHILGLFAIASCVILTSLRLMGTGLVEAPASSIARNTRIWLHIGVIAAIGSGLLMGLSNASKLYNNTAFLWKMTAMIAAIIFSYAVMLPTAKAEGAVRPATRIALIVGILIWLLAFLIMIPNKGGNVGVFHVMFGGTLIAVAALKGRMRWAFLTIMAVLVLGLQVVTHFVPGLNDPYTEVYTNINKVFMWGAGAFIFVVAAANILGMSAKEDSNRLARLVGYCTILAWVTVGAGGRWIGLT